MSKVVEVSHEIRARMVGKSIQEIEAEICDLAKIADREEERAKESEFNVKTCRYTIEQLQELIRIKEAEEIPFPPPPETPIGEMIDGGGELEW